MNTVIDAGIVVILGRQGGDLTAQIERAATSGAPVRVLAVGHPLSGAQSRA